MTTPSALNTNGFLSSTFENDLSGNADVNLSKKSTALSNKLTNVLSSSYADSEVREALRLLDARGSQNAEETRTNLRFDAQQEVINANARIVEDFGKVANQLKRVGALITILNQTCDDMRDHIQLAKQETTPMLEEASTLLARKHETASKQHLLNAFNEHFLISDDDLTALTSSAEPVNDEFFAVLLRTKQIHKDCEILLGSENQRLGLELMEQTTRNLDAGYKKLYTWVQREFKNLDLEDPHISGSIRRSLRALSERPTLFQNCLDFFGEARQITLSEAFQQALTDSTIGSSKAIEFSTHDPLRYVGDMLAWVHSTTVSEQEALEGLFISDAKEISRGLNAGRSSEPWARLRRTSSAANGTDISDEEDGESTTSAFDGHAALNSLISRNMASVAQILNQRIALTVRNLTDQITIYKCYNLLLFYQDIFVKLLGITSLDSQTPRQDSSEPSRQSQSANNNDSNSNTLLLALSTLQSQAIDHFDSTVSEDIEAHASSIDPLPTLQPPGILQSNLALFATILHLRAPNLSDSELTQLYSTLLAPILSLCASAATTLSPPSPHDDENATTNGNEPTSDETPSPTSFESTIYRLNYMHPIHTTLTTVSKDTTLATFVSSPLRSAQQEIDRLLDVLSDTVTTRFLAASGVRALLDLLGNGQNTFKNIDGGRKMVAEKLEDASGVLDSFLASALMDVQDDLGKLSDKAAAKGVVAGAVENFSEEFEMLVRRLDGLDCESVGAGEQEKDRGSEDEVEALLLRDLYPRTVAEVRALLN